MSPTDRDESDRTAETLHGGKDVQSVVIQVGLLLILTSIGTQWWILRQGSPAALFDMIQQRRIIGNPSGTRNMCWYFLTNSSSSCMTDLDLNRTNTLRLSALANLTIAIIGDSRMRDFFVFLRSMLLKRPFYPWPFQEDASYYNYAYNVSLKFYWCRYPDGHLKRLLHKWRYKRPPDYVIFGIGVWSVYQFGPTGITAFKRKLGRVADEFDALRDRTTSIWVQTLPGNPKTVMAEVGVNLSQTTLPTTGVVERFGDLLSEVGQSRHFVVWTSAHDVARLHPKLYRDEVHPGFGLIQQFACQFLSALNSSCWSATMRRGHMRLPVHDQT